MKALSGKAVSGAGWSSVCAAVRALRSVAAASGTGAENRKHALRPASMVWGAVVQNCVRPMDL